MSELTNKEKLGLLKRGLERRLIGVNPAIKQRQDEIEKITKVRQEYIDRIEKYSDDETVVNMLNSQLQQFDRQYAGTKQNYLNAIEEIKETEPIVKKVLKHIKDIESGKENGSLLYLLIPLFFEGVLTDWHEFEQSIAEERNNKNE